MQEFYGSDGTRTRDLRRDRPDSKLRGRRPLAGIGHESRALCPRTWGIAGYRRELPPTSCGMCAGWQSRLVVASEPVTHALEPPRVAEPFPSDTEVVVATREPWLETRTRL